MRESAVNEKKRAISNYFASILSYAVIIIVGLLEHRFLPLYYGSEVNGLVSSIAQFIEYLWLFEAGVGATALQAMYKPVALNDRDGINSILNASGQFYKRAGFFYLGGLILLSFVYSPIFRPDVAYFKVVLIVFLSGFANVLNFWISGKYTNLLKAEGKNYLLSNLLTYSIILVGIVRVVLLWLKIDIVLIILCSFVVNISTTVFILFYIRRNYRWIDSRVAPDFNAISQRKYALIREISRLAFNNADVIIISYFCGFKVVSVYFMYKLITNQMNNLIGSFPTAVEFSQGQLFQTDRAEYIKRADMYESVFSSAFHTLYAVTLFLFLPFMRLYTAGITDINYIDPKLPILFVSLEILHMARMMMNQTITVAGHFKLTTKQTIAETVINVVVSVVAVQFWGIYGALIGTIVALLYRTNDIIIYSNTRILGRRPFKTYAIHLINLALLVGFQFVYPHIVGEINNYWTFMLYGLIIVVMTGVVMLGVQMAVFPDLRHAIADFAGRLIKREKS